MRERGLKLLVLKLVLLTLPVAPVRERGLKLWSVLLVVLLVGRSREGAWIEISLSDAGEALAICRSREGAWIEMPR